MGCSGAPHHVQLRLEHLQGWRPHNLGGQRAPVSDHPHSENVLLCAQVELHVFHSAPKKLLIPITELSHYWLKSGTSHKFGISVKLMFSKGRSCIKHCSCVSLFVHIPVFLYSPEHFPQGTNVPLTEPNQGESLLTKETADNYRAGLTEQKKDQSSSEQINKSRVTAETTNNHC